MSNPKNIMVLGWNWKQHCCNHCQKYGQCRIDIMDLDNGDEFTLCNDCYEGLLGIAELHPCEGGACET